MAHDHRATEMRGRRAARQGDASDDADPPRDADASSALGGFRLPTWWRRAGTIAGILLLLAALFMVVRSPEPAKAMAVAARGDPLLLVALPLLVLVNVVSTAEVFRALMRRFGRVGRLEMIELMAASTLLNFVPMRPGLVGRVVWHSKMNDIAARHSVRTIVESIAIGAGCVASIVAALLCAPLLPHWSTMSLAIAAPFGPALAALLVPALRPFALACAARAVDLLVWGLRYHIAFQLVGSPIAPEAALAIASAATMASLIPIAGNGLGIREWTIGLLAPVLAGADLDAGLTADLVNRAAEILAMTPAGLAALAALYRRARLRRPGG